MAGRSGRRSVPEPRVATAATPTTSLEAVERPRRIDAYIDYFASGGTHRISVAADLCGEALLDGDVC